jgi:hypothetical protein
MRLVFLSPFILLICFFLFGCSKSEVRTTTEDAHIKNITIMYGQYLAKNKGQPPANEQAFRKFLQDTITSRQQQATVDDWLTSPRDQEVYGILFGTRGKSDRAVFVYEKKGKNGKRFVGFSNGGVEEVDATKFKELVPGA